MQQSTKNIGIATAILVVIAAGAVLYVLQGILLPFILAGLLSILFRPIVVRLRALKVPMALCIPIVLLIAGGALWGISMIISAGIVSATEKAPLYEARLSDLITQANLGIRKLSIDLFGRPSAMKFENILDPSALAGLATSSVGSLVTLIGDGTLVLLFLVFMVPAGETFPRKLAAIRDRIPSVDVVSIFTTVHDKVLRYLGIKTLLNIVVGLLTWIILAIMDVDFAALIALITFLFHYLPNIGSIISTFIPGFVALVQFESFGFAALVVVILSAMQNLMGNILEPRIMGDSLDLSPVLVLFSLAFWGWMWGIVGMILSVPIMAVVKVVLEAIPATQPIAVLMGSGKRLPSR